MVTFPTLTRTLSHQNKEEGTGFCCDVVKVEVDSGLSKEQLVDIFINSGNVIYSVILVNHLRYYTLCLKPTVNLGFSVQV